MFPKRLQALKKQLQLFRKGRAIYVNFPNHSVALDNSSGNIQVGGLHLPLGHAGVVTIDEDGHTKYYEYGRYKYSGFGAEANEGRGNYRNIRIPDMKADESEEDYFNRLAQTFPNESSVEGYFVDVDDLDAVTNYIINDANNPDRSPYSVLTNKTCGGVARQAIDAGRGTVGKVVDMLRPIFFTPLVFPIARSIYYRTPSGNAPQFGVREYKYKRE